MIVKFEELDDERQKEAKLVRSQMQKERDETKEAVADIAKSLQDQMDGNAKDLLDVVKREKGDRERDVEVIKRRIEDEKKSDVGKPTKEDDPKPASEPEAEKTKKSSGGGETKQPVPTSRKGSTGGASKTVPNTPGTAPKTVPNTPTSAVKTAGSNKEQDKKSDGSGFYGFLKRA